MMEHDANEKGLARFRARPFFNSYSSSFTLLCKEQLSHDQA